MAATEKVTIATPEYWGEACKHLMKKDRVMKRLIPQFGEASPQYSGVAMVTFSVAAMLSHAPRSCPWASL